jgi:uncharacterized protein YPO0396
MTDIMARMSAIKKESPAKIMPTAQMRADMDVICEFYAACYDWPQDHLAQLKADYMEALQVEDFDTVAMVLAQSAAIAREGLKKHAENFN